MIIRDRMTKEEKEQIVYMWLNKPCTFDEIVRDTNQFRDVPVSEDEIEEIISEAIWRRR